MWLWMLTVAWGGGVYINDILIEPTSIADTTLEGVSVRFDGDGNVFITAPKYEVKVVGTEPPPASPPSAGVTAARYWLVSEDGGSTGHTVECWINGRQAAVLRSGEPQRILDVGPWLQVGTNRIEMKATSLNAQGGNLYVYVGTGRADETGTVRMDEPAVQFGVSPSRKGEMVREYSFVVD